MGKMSAKQWLALANDQFEREDYERAVQSYSNAIGEDPALAEAWAKRGDAVEDRAQAVKDYSEAIRLKPANGEYYAKRAFAYGRLFELDKAIADYDTALRIHPRKAEWYSERGDVWEKAYEYRKALADYRKAAQIDPDNPDYAGLVASAMQGVAMQDEGVLGKPGTGPGTGKKPEAPSAEAAFCTECGAELEAGEEYCPECGAKAE